MEKGVNLLVNFPLPPPVFPPLLFVTNLPSSHITLGCKYPISFQAITGECVALFAAKNQGLASCCFATSMTRETAGSVISPLATKRIPGWTH